MSTLAYVREQKKGTLDYEGQIFGSAYALMESVRDEVGKPNPMAFAVDENALIDDDELDAILMKAEEDGEDGEEAEEQAMTSRGEYFKRSDVLKCLRAYQKHFAANPTLREGRAIGEHLAIDLADMIAVIESAKGRVRIYLS